MTSCCRRFLLSSKSRLLPQKCLSTLEPTSSTTPTRESSRRFVFEYPGANLANTAGYLAGTYPGWSYHFLPHLNINKFQRRAMFERECERAMFAQDPGQYDMEELGFTREFEKREEIIKIEKQRPTEYVIYHDLKEMWKRRQGMDLPFVNVGSFVEVKLRSKWGLSRPVTYGGVVIEKEHKDLSAHFILRKNLSSYGYGVENLIPLYSPYLESIEVVSYQVRDDPSGLLHCLRDLTPDQCEVQDPLPQTIIDPVSELEIPLFVPLRLEYKEQKRQKRFMHSSKHLRPKRKDTLRNYKLWETDPAKRYSRRTVKGRHSRA